MAGKSIPLGDALHRAAGILAEAGVEAPRREARLLAAHLLGAAPSALLPATSLIDDAAYAELVGRRATREPLALITGRRGFWTLELEVSPDTLVPRADSETLVEAVLDHVADKAALLRVLDLGTGTGCLLLAVLDACPRAFGIGVDLSEPACRLAARNAAANGLAERSAFVTGDWAAALQGRFHVILSNPPYIETAALAGLMPEVRLFEPARALDGGAGGLSAYAHIIESLPRLLAQDGYAVLELGAGQEAAVRHLAGERGLTHLTTRADLAGIARAAVFTREQG